MASGDPAADREAHPGALAPLVSRRETSKACSRRSAGTPRPSSAIVMRQVSPSRSAPDVEQRGPVGVAVADRVPDQIAEELPEQRGVAVDGRQRPGLDHRPDRIKLRAVQQPRC
jgi:hypothetical protein